MSSKYMPRYDQYRATIGIDNLPVGNVPGVEAPNPFKRGSRFWNLTAQHELMTNNKPLADWLRAKAEAGE